MKQKIYWFVQQLYSYGGTEIVTLQLADSLASTYDITLVSSEECYEGVKLPISSDIKILSLGYSHGYVNYANTMSAYVSGFHFLKAGSLFFKTAWNFLFGRFSTRKKIKKMTSADNILIASSLDSYLVMPRGRIVFFHYHFNAKYFFSLNERFCRLFCRRPDKYIFLTKATFSKVLLKNSAVPLCYVHNPIRLKSVFSAKYHNNSLVFIGRYSPQKDPLFMIRSAYEMKKDGLSFHLSLYGEGPMKPKMERLVKELDLDTCITIGKSCNNISDILQSSDLLLLTSLFEGFPLVVGEANSQSVPVLSINWGDGLQETIEDGVNGCIVNERVPKAFALKAEEMLSDRTALLKLKESSYEYSKKLSIDNISSVWKNEILIKKGR